MDDADKDRLYAGMTPKEIQAHELWVTKYKAEKLEQAERQAVERRKRAARLRVMTDEDVVASFLPGDADPKDLLADLRDAGFVREEPKAKVEFVFSDGHRIEVFGRKEGFDLLRDQLLKSDPGLRYSKGVCP